MTRREGFTLLEVLLAVAILAMVLLPLVGMVSANLRRLSEARDELDAMRMAEQRAFEIESQMLAGSKVPSGSDEGVYEPPHADLAWQVRVDNFVLPLPDGVDRENVRSLLFKQPREGGTSPLRRIQVRVFPVTSGPEAADPFVLIVAPASEAAAAAPLPPRF